MIRLLLGDDHRIVREGLKQILADAPDLCIAGEAQSGADVLEQAVIREIIQPQAAGLVSRQGD